MRRITLRLTVSVITFAVGVVVAGMWFVYQSPAVRDLGLAPCSSPPDYEMLSVPCLPPDQSAFSSIPVIEYCDLIHGSNSYRNQIVRVRGRYWYNMENSVLDDAACHNESSSTWIEVEAYSNFDEAMKPVYTRYGTAAKLGAEAEVVFLGKLSGPSSEGYGHLNGCRYQLSVMKVEDVRPLPNVPR